MLTNKKSASYLSNLLKLCIDRRALRDGKLLQAYLFRCNLYSVTFLHNRLIELYLKCGHASAARHVFDGMPLRNFFSYLPLLVSYCKSDDLGKACDLFAHMPERDTFSWNLMMGTLSRNGYKDKALEGYYQMRISGLMPTSFTLAIVLSACRNLVDVECGRECHAVAIKLELDNNIYVGNTLLGMYMKCDLVEDADTFFKDMPQHNEASLTVMMTGFSEANRVDEAFDIFRLMHRSDIIDYVALSCVLGAFTKYMAGKIVSQTKNYEKCFGMHGKQVHVLVIKLGFESDLHVSNSLLDMYAKHDNLELAEVLFNSMSEVNLVSWNVMIAGYGRQCNEERVMEYVEQMKRCGFEPNEVTNASIITACAKIGDVDTGRRVFNSLSSPSLASWNAMLSSYLQNEYPEEVVMLFRDMQFKNVKPDRATFAIVLSSCACSGLLEAGKQIHASSVKAEHYADLYVANGLIGMYSKCGKVAGAKSIFSSLSEVDVVCCNSMLAGLSFSCLGNESFSVFKQMLWKGIRPTEFSYASLISCCSSLASLSQGQQIHGLVLKCGYEGDEYIGTTLVGMYCKCGDVDKARQVFDKISCESIATWNEMLHGYAINGLGEEAVYLFEAMVKVGVVPNAITFIAVLTACSHSGLVDAGISILNRMHEEHGIEPLRDHYTCIVDSLGRAGRFNEIEMLIGKMHFSDDPIVWEILLSSCRLHGNVNLARRAAEELFRLNSNNPAGYTLLANMYSSLNGWDDVKDIRGMMNQLQVSKRPGHSWA